MNLKKNWKVIYRAAVSQRLRNTGLRDGQPVNRGSIFRTARDFPLHHRDHSRSVSPAVFYLMCTKGPFQGVNPPKREADCSPTSTIERVNA